MPPLRRRPPRADPLDLLLRPDIGGGGAPTGTGGGGPPGAGVVGGGTSPGGAGGGGGTTGGSTTGGHIIEPSIPGGGTPPGSTYPSSSGGGAPSAPAPSPAAPAYDPVTYETVTAATSAAPVLPPVFTQPVLLAATSALNPPQGPAARAQARETRPRRRAGATAGGAARPSLTRPLPIPGTVPPSQNTEGVLRGGGSGGTLASRLGDGGPSAGAGGGGNRLTVGVPSIVPPEYRKAVAKHGQRLNAALDEAGVDMTGPEYLARLIQFESGWSPTAENPSSAYGLGQFIDSTAADFRDRLGVETQDPSRPNQMIKAASMHASGKYGYGPLYAGYNPGYSDTDPILSEEGGQNVPVQIRRQAAERAAEGGPVASGGGTAAKAPGVYAGSRKRLKELLGPYAQTEEWQDKENRGYSSLHDIATHPQAFAADISTDEGAVDRILRQLAKENPDANVPDPSGVDYGTTGLESGLQYKGYDVEFLPYPHGGGPHTHIGLEWTGGTPPAGTVAGAPGAGGSAVTSATTSGAVAGAGGLADAAAGGGGINSLMSLLGGREQSTGMGTTVMDNPLAAQAAMPAAIGEGTSLTAMLRGEPGMEGEEDPLLSLIRPRRRLAGR